MNVRNYFAIILSYLFPMSANKLSTIVRKVYEIIGRELRKIAR